MCGFWASAVAIGSPTAANRSKACDSENSGFKNSTATTSLFYFKSGLIVVVVIGDELPKLVEKFHKFSGRANWGSRGLIVQAL